MRNLESNIWLFNFACANIRGDNLQKVEMAQNTKIESWNDTKIRRLRFAACFMVKKSITIGIHNFTYVLDILSSFIVLEKCLKVYMTKFKPDWQDLLVIGPKEGPNFFLPLSLQEVFIWKRGDTIERIFLESQRTKTNQENR